MDLGFTSTLLAFAACAAATLFFGWMGARPPDPRRGPRMLPHRMFMLLSSAAALIFLVHLINLLGFKTGR